MLLDELRSRGYAPQGGVRSGGTPASDIYELVPSGGNGAVRIILEPDRTIQIHTLDTEMAPLWRATFTAGAPDQAILRVTAEAEAMLTGRTNVV